MSDEREVEIAKFKSARADCMDEYFKNRPHISRTKENERLIEAGFRLAYEYFVEGIRHGTK